MHHKSFTSRIMENCRIMENLVKQATDKIHLSQTLKCVITSGLYENNHINKITLIVLNADFGFTMKRQSNSLVKSSYSQL